MTFWIRWLRSFQHYLDRWTNPSTEELVSRFIVHTASLELSKTEVAELAPVKGCCGPFKLSGNSLPVVEYVVFDKQKKPLMMEFVKIRVEISKPASIRYAATIHSINTADPLRHGEGVEVKSAYKEPFENLIVALFNYFPFFRVPPGMGPDVNAKVFVKDSNGNN